ncbi:hypothetical protein U1Q18_050558 [Sarracenia purpurea var. burkii]
MTRGVRLGRDREEDTNTSTTNDEIDNTYQVIKQANEIKCMPLPSTGAIAEAGAAVTVAVGAGASATRVTAPAEPPRKTHLVATAVTVRAGASLNVVSPPLVSSSGLLSVNHS